MSSSSYLQIKLAKLQALQEKQDRLYAAQAARARSQAQHWMRNPTAWVDEFVEFPPIPAGARRSWSPDRRAGLAPYQAASMEELAESGRLLVFGPHGLGKSATMSLVAWWFIATREMAGIDWKLITTASSWKQLRDFLWPEIHKWSKRIRWEAMGRAAPQEGRDLLDLAYKGEWGAATAAASSDPARMEGAHARHLMYMLDEGKGIPDPTWDAIEGAFSTEGLEEDAGIRDIFAVAMSTPGAASGRFYSVASRKPGYEDWRVRHVKKDEVIAAGRMSQHWMEQRRLQWGEGSSVYQMRVLGEFWTDDPDALIPLWWVEAAQARWEEWKAAGRPALEGKRWLGVDVAGGGSDRTVMARRVGAAITRFEMPAEVDLMKIADLISIVSPPHQEIIDTMGIGAGVTSRLRQMGRQPVAYVGAAGTSIRDSSGEYGFTNVRSAAYWRVREMLDPNRGHDAMLPPEPRLVADLTAPTWTVVTGGNPPRIKVEPKPAVKTRLGRSPDWGDAVAMAYWGDAAKRPATVGTPAGTLPASQGVPGAGSGFRGAGGALPTTAASPLGRK